MEPNCEELEACHFVYFYKGALEKWNITCPTCFRRSVGGISAVSPTGPCKAALFSIEG